MARSPREPLDEITLKEAEQLDPDDYCSANELAAYWDVTRYVVLMAARRGSIPGSFQISGRWYFHKKDATEGWQPLAVRKRLEANAKALDPAGPASSGSFISATHKKTHAAQKLRYLKELSARVTPDEWAAICDKAIEQAKQGDRHARVWLGNYLMGTPVQRIEAEIDLQSDKGFEDSERVRAIQALLEAVLARQEAEIIDVESTSSDSSSDALGEGPS